MTRDIPAREFVALALAMALGANNALGADQPAKSHCRLLFTSQGKTGLIHPDGSSLRYFDFHVPGQATWQPSLIFDDGHRLVFLSMEPRRDGPGKPFDEYYTQTPTHLWIHDLNTGTLEEIAHRERLAPFETPSLLIGDDRLLVQVVRKNVGQVYNMKLDGTDAKEFTRAGEGLPYGFSVSPDRKRVAFHLAGSEGYQVWTSDADGGNRVRIASAPGHLYFGTNWSPGQQWIVYVDCQPGTDPGHDWADVCVGRPDGSLHRVLTQSNAMWFGATYGNVQSRGGGSNIPAWSVDGKILYPRRIRDSKTPWEYRVGKPDVDHFNRDYKPELARGGTYISRLDPETLREENLTPPTEGVWDFRASPSPDGKLIAFCRAKIREAPALWVMNVDGSGARVLTRGVDELGADHPRWLPAEN